MTNGKKYGVEVDADRKSLVRHMMADSSSAPASHYQGRTMSGTGKYVEISSLIALWVILMGRCLCG